VEANKATIPLCVYSAVLLLVSLRSELARTKARANHLLELFRRELGVTPKSERGKPSPQPKPKKDDEDYLKSLKKRRDSLAKEIRRYEDRLGKGRKKRDKSSPKPQPIPPDPADLAFEKSGEALFTGNLAKVVAEDKRMDVGRVDNFANPRGLHVVTDDRKRYEYGVTTKIINLKVETVTDPRTGKSVTASTDEIGPPNSQATWTAIANTVISVIGYAIPVNRLASMLKQSCPYFTTTRLLAHLKLAAEMFSPIYSHLGEALADADVLQGDDTKARVIEIKKDLEERGELKPVSVESLIGRIAKIFGRAFDKKRGKGKKKSLNVSVVIGKTEAADPRSYVFFFRSHLGTFGDLVSKMLENRRPKNKKLTIVSDLATTNLVSKDLYKKFDIIHAGCSAHARRPFWRQKDNDDRICYWMLSAFLILEQIEDRIDELGRTRARIIRYRQRYAKKIWEAVLRRSESVMRGETKYGNFWPKTSEIYGACEYVVKHYKKLTAYLDDPRLPSNNNLSERVLRWDKIMQDSSKFRLTEQGRLHVDILRTIVHTCSAAEVELRDYLLFVFKNGQEIEVDPAQYTPYAFAKKQGGQSSLKA
jgi:hypothetical protein